MANTDSKNPSKTDALGRQTFDAPQYSGTKEMASNIILFVICFAILLACLWALGTYPEGGPYWFAGAILLYALTFLVPLNLLPTKTNTHVKGGSEKNLL